MCGTDPVSNGNATAATCFRMGRGHGVEVPDFIKEAVVARINEGGLGYGFYDEPIPVLEAFKSRMSHAFDWNVETSDVLRVHDVIQGLEWVLEL
ncbi:MAG: hypothetical protein Ct9H300mP26_1810 [Acidimicrobiales bacterium]|nr:MAG: hypothetical protein Ct9H300mP26_1810 [Acidimicrobiales bacterium]